jgi:hypothetical protein
VAAVAKGAADDSGDGHHRLGEGLEEERDRHTQQSARLGAYDRRDYLQG